MVKKLALFFVFGIPFTLFAQLPDVCTGQAPPAYLCNDACIQCDFSGYAGNTTLSNFLGFVAGGTTVTFTATASGCSTGDGLQMALSAECGGNFIAINPGAPGGAALPLELSANVTPGRHYFLRVAGYNGDQCAFTLAVSPQGAAQAPVVGATGAIEGMGTICPGANVTYRLPADVPGASYYLWTTPPGWTINGQPGPTAMLPAPGGRSITVTAGNSGGVVSVQPLNACTSGTSVWKSVQVQPIPPTILPPLTLTLDDLPYYWINGDVILNAGIFQTVLSSWLGCDSTVRQQIVIVNASFTSGKVFADIDGNGQFNGADYPLQGVVVSTGSGQLSSTNVDGIYTFINVPLGDSIRAAVNLTGVLVSPDVHIRTANQSSGYNFAVQDAGSAPDLRIDLTNTNVFRPGFLTGLVLDVRNNGFVQQPGSQAALYLPANLTLVSTNPAPTSMAGDTLFWDLGTLLPGQSGVVQVQLQTPVSTPIGSTVDIFAAALPLNDAIPANNTTILHKPVVGSYDPNDKQVDPPYATPAMLAGLPPLEYTVRFQNTGNYPAEVVKITDTLQATLDPATFRLLSASHACTWKILTPGVIEFTFANINLPDSVHNEPESHGFVKYSVRPRPGLAYGDVVENFADIYFDFNPPVRTNTAGTEVVYFIPGNPPNGAGMSSRPNPATYKIFFAWDTPLAQAGTLRLFTINGVFVTELPVDAGSSGTELYVADRPEGAYVALLEAGAQRYVKVVLIRRSLFQVRRN